MNTFEDIYQNLSPTARIALLHVNKMKGHYQHEFRRLLRDVKKIENKEEMGIVLQAFEELLDWMLGNYRLVCRGRDPGIKVIDEEGNLEFNGPVTRTELREAHENWFRLKAQENNKGPSLLGPDGNPVTPSGEVN